MLNITIQGYRGFCTLQASKKQWQRLSPVSKVLYVHENARDTTGGFPFQFINISEA